MKSLITICLALFVCVCGHAQTTLYSQSFNSGSAADWTLNTSDLGGVNNAPTGNAWYINNVYVAGTLGTATPTEPAAIVGGPTSYYMHINCGSTFAPLYGSNDNFLADGSGQTYFASLNSAAAVSTVGYTNVYFSFWWICNGSSDTKGNVYYRTSASGTWTMITAPTTDFFGSSVWSLDSFHLAAFDGQTYLQFGFQFTNGVSSTGTDPAFGVDQITVTG